jgi:hypothetical protein
VSGQFSGVKLINMMEYKKFPFFHVKIKNITDAEIENEMRSLWKERGKDKRSLRGMFPE